MGDTSRIGAASGFLRAVKRIDEQAVHRSAMQHLRQDAVGRDALAAAYQQAAFGFEDNAREYDKTGAFDPDTQLRLARVAQQRCDELRSGRPVDVIDGIPF